MGLVLDYLVVALLQGTECCVWIWKQLEMTEIISVTEGIMALLMKMEGRGRERLVPEHICYKGSGRERLVCSWSVELGKEQNLADSTLTLPPQCYLRQGLLCRPGWP